MKNRTTIIAICIFFVVLMIAWIILANHNRNNEINRTDTATENNAAKATIPNESTGSGSNDSGDSQKPVFEGDLQSMIESLSNSGSGDVNRSEIKNAYVDENGHLFIVLNNRTLDAGVVRDTDSKSSDSSKKYTVNFYDYDGTLVKSQQVVEGKMAIAPENPTREGYEFCGWDHPLTSIQSDLDVTAQYQPIASVPQIRVNDTVVFSHNGTCTVAISIRNNPGILGMTLQLDYDSSALSLTNAQIGEALNMLSFTKPGKMNSPCKFVWDGIELNDSDIYDGTVLSLTFEINEGATGEHPISLSYESGDIIGKDLSPLNVELVSGSIIIIN